MRLLLPLLFLALAPAELVKQLGDPSFEKREQAQQALEESDEDVDAALAEGAKSADPEIAARAKAVQDARKASVLRGVEMELLPAVRSVRAGEELRYSIRLSNKGKSAVLLLRATPGSRNSLKPPKIVSSFENSPGLTIQFGARPPCPPSPCPLEAADFLELKPGESAELISEKDCVGLTPSMPGRFAITITYTLAGPFVCKDKEAEALSGRLVPCELHSKPVGIEVTK